MTDYEICNEMILSENYADYIVEYQDNIETIQSLYNPGCVQIVDNRFAVIQTPVTEFIDNVYIYDYNMTPALFTLLDLSSLEVSGINQVRNQAFLQLTGSGTIVGIIDTGIDYTHPAFLNNDGTSRIISIWDQTINNGQWSETFLYGTEYSQEEINEALKAENPFDVVPSQDLNGHGTFMAGVAAGNIMLQDEFSGIAPNAEIIVVKLKPTKNYLRDFYIVPDDAVAYQENDIMQAVHYIVDKATRMGKPVAISIGLGTNRGSHSGYSYLSRFLNIQAQKLGVGIVVAMGNELNNGSHYYGELEREQTRLDVEFNVAEGETGFVMEFWAETPTILSVGMTSPIGDIINEIQPQLNRLQMITFLLESTVVYVNYRIVDSLSGNQLIILRFSDPTPGIWRLTVFGNNFENLKRDFHIWLPVRGFILEDTRFLEPNPDTTLTVPAAAGNVLSVAAYNYNDGSIYVNSSRGYTANHRVAPDFVAPGVDIRGPLPGGGFGTKSGTSVAAAYTAGATALLLEWGIVKENDVSMDTIKIRAYFIRGASRRSDLLYPNNVWGYGTLQVYDIFDALRGN